MKENLRKKIIQEETSGYRKTNKWHEVERSRIQAVMIGNEHRKKW